MRRTYFWIGVCVVVLLFSEGLMGQQLNSRPTGREVSPNRLITFNGALKDASGQPRLGTVGITFTLYAAQEGGDALWRESQTVQTDEQGRYTILLGSTEREGLPLEVFSNGKAQWLGVQVQGEEEQQRVLLVAVPYALKAADADTVGGKAVSSFVLYEDLAKAQQAGNTTIITAENGSASIAGRQGTGQKANQQFQGGGPLLAKAGGIGPVYGHEIDSNTWYGLFAGGGITTGEDNSFFGVMAGHANTAGNYNAFFGSGAGSGNSTGTLNSFFGYQAGYATTTTGNNSFFGARAGWTNTTGSLNSFFGNAAGYSNGVGSYNAFFGGNAGYSNTDGWGNAFFGFEAGNSNITGSFNSFIGRNAGRSNTTGASNSFFGNDAGYSNLTGGANSFFGAGAGAKNTASNNSFFGLNSGNSNTTGEMNSFFGKDSGNNNTTGGSNSFFGHRAGSANTEGFTNSFFGDGAGLANTTGAANCFFGYGAGWANTEGHSNAFFGRSAGERNTTAYFNSFFGPWAGFLNTTGGANSFFGYSAGYDNTIGANNSFYGVFAGRSNTMGVDNSFFGTSAGSNNNTGYSNAFVGKGAGENNTMGFWNAFFGMDSGHANDTGTSNSFFGQGAGFASISGNDNAFFGRSAGLSNTTEHNNTTIGAYSDGAAGITNATAIGYRAKVTQSDSLVLGSINGTNGATASTNVGIGTTAPKARLDVIGPIYSSAWGPLTGSGLALLYDQAGAGTGLLLSYDSAADRALDFAFRGRTIDLRSGYWGNDSVLYVNDSGKIGIGTKSPTEKLHIVGNLRLQGSFIYSAPETELPDYVFDRDYKLMSIEELERYIATEKHLPNVPKASEIKQNGLNLSEFQMKLLEKIEELTLYTVQQAKTIEGNKNKVSALKSENADLRVRLNAMEQMIERIARRDRDK